RRNKIMYFKKISVITFLSVITGAFSLLFINGCEDIDLSSVEPATKIAAAVNGLVKIVDEPAGENCENGGKKVLSGLDNNGNNVLDDDEILSTAYVCNGNDGEDALPISILEEPATSCGEEGGVKIIFYYDLDGNESPYGDDDPAYEDETENPEFIESFEVCNGQNGEPGEDAHQILVDIAPSSTCINGGSSVSFVRDMNDDGFINIPPDTQLQQVDICNGEDSSISGTGLTVEPYEGNCAWLWEGHTCSYYSASYGRPAGYYYRHGWVYEPCDLVCQDCLLVGVELDNIDGLTASEVLIDWCPVQ
ncbi:MAG: hypothetical protein JXA66_04675, partial [Oligoflexia bacterium]|nr:hypothetical protein [Oligoflexia bacterium]